MGHAALLREFFPPFLDVSPGVVGMEDCENKELLAEKYLARHLLRTQLPQAHGDLDNINRLGRDCLGRDCNISFARFFFVCTRGFYLLRERSWVLSGLSFFPLHIPSFPTLLSLSIFSPIWR